MISVFFAYAREDELLLQKLEAHLSLLKRQGLISTWYDRQVALGSDSSEVIDKQLEQASIILLLVSPSFLASDYCYQVEMKRALERHETGQARVIPLIMRPVDCKDAPFAHLQVLPTSGKAITIWSNQDKAFLDVTEGIRKVIEEHLNPDPLAVEATESLTIQPSLPQNPAKPNLSTPDLGSNRYEEITSTLPLASLLQPFEFDVALYKRSLFKSFLLRSRSTASYHRQAQYFTEDLGNGVVLEMVLIPNGSFLMGSPDTEAERSSDEGPQHMVKVASFFMGKYPVTQAQWRAIAALPKINRDLNSDPSRCKGIDRPVEQVSWYDVNEFCARLSRKTGREYRLPSEAEWEYACRAGTTPPFHFGESISPNLANYDSRFIYNSGVKGKPCRQITRVGIFQVANGFGLYDMLGNVWEWCTDSWHDSYETPGYKDAPSDGAIWKVGSDSTYRLLRGGSWRDPPKYCRAAFRARRGPDARDDDLGFRIALSCATAS